MGSSQISSPMVKKSIAISNKKVSIKDLKDKDDYSSPNKFKQSL
jgi:hypothetical protein